MFPVDIDEKGLFSIALKNRKVRFQTQIGVGPKAIPATLSGLIVKNNRRSKSVEILTKIGNRFNFTYSELAKFKSLQII